MVFTFSTMKNLKASNPEQVSEEEETKEQQEGAALSFTEQKKKSQGI